MRPYLGLKTMKSWSETPHWRETILSALGSDSQEARASRITLELPAYQITLLHRAAEKHGITARGFMRHAIVTRIAKALDLDPYEVAATGVRIHVHGSNGNRFSTMEPTWKLDEFLIP
jgi:hypothetical protein